jgi:hypothetical protein
MSRDDWDVHADPATHVPEEHQLRAGTRVSGTVICHHPFGLGIRLTDCNQCGHVDVPLIRDGPIRGPEDYPPIGRTAPAVVIRYDVLGQLRLSLRPSDIANNTFGPP